MFTGGHAVLKGEGCIWGCRSRCFIRSLRILSSWINSVTSLTGPFHGGRAISTQNNSAAICKWILGNSWEANAVAS